MTDELRVTPTRVTNVANEIAEATSDFHAQLRHVDDQVRNLLGSGWKGDPGSQFHDAFVEWHEGAGHVSEGMTKMASTLRDVATSFRVGDGG